VVPPGSLKPEHSRKRGLQRKRVLFVCLGNSCRSQMAEAFARAYGSDVLIPSSAGLTPAPIVAPLTLQVLEEKNIRADGQFPKELDLMAGEASDVIVNMSGYPLPSLTARVVEWSVQDPIGESETVYRDVANQIEGLVMRLILDLRSGRPPV
jgi:arsenate reductase